jgi:hypothetical protein
MRRTAFCLALLMARPSLGQNILEPVALIGKFREQARTYVEDLSRLTCIESTRQTVSIRDVTLSEMREDSCDTKQYKLFAVQSLSLARGPAYDPARRRVGTTSDWHERLTEASLDSNSEFLLAIANPQANIDLRWLHLDTLNGQRVSVFSFHVPASEGFALADVKGMMRVPYKGLLYADLATGAFVRVALTCEDIPRDSEYTGADLTLEFRSFNIAGSSVVLPSHSLVRFQMVSGHATNEADYRSYRLASFSADSEITFGDEVPEEKR